MPLQNRVTPFGDIVATSARGTMMGNRGGPLHDEDRRLGAVRWRTKVWITCLLEFKGRRREVMTPGRYTELFFLDEVTALAAGHRPCGECRKADYIRFVDAWTEGDGRKDAPKAAEIDAVLHKERVVSPGRDKRIHRELLENLPDMVMISLPERREEAFLVMGDALYPWTPLGYGKPITRPRGTVGVLTPPSIVKAVMVGYRPAAHGTVA